MLRKIYFFLCVIGIDLRKTFRSLRGMSQYLTNLTLISRKLRLAEGHFSISSLVPCLHDRYDTSGTASGQYFHQDLLVAQKIYKAKPERHVDVGSRVDGFVAHIATFRPIEVLDIRPLESKVKNIIFRQFDLTQILPEFREFCDSLSCLHALEHIGLGRYGDEVEPDGYLKAWRNLFSMIKPGGRLYFSVPIGPQRIEFDAHRVFSIPYLLKMINGNYEILDFSYIDDKGDLITGVKSELLGPKAGNNFGCKYGCGVFELKKVGDNKNLTL